MFIIAIHNFSLLFFHRQWSDRTSYITLLVSWGVLVLDLCIGNFALANPKKGPYYGIAGYWCWISPAYSMERLTTEYLIMFASAGSSFMLYLLVFFHLRGNITVSAGWNIHFHQQPQTRVSRTIDGAYIITDDRRVDSHLMVVARRMLTHPIAYIILVVPLAATRFSGFSDTSVPFPVIIFSASLFVLTGFINAVLFCITHNILAGGRRQRASISMPWDHVPSDAYSPSWRDSKTRYTKSTSKKGAVERGRSPSHLRSGIANDAEVGRGEALLGPSFGHPSSPTQPLRAYGGRQRVESNTHHTGRLSSLMTLDERMSVRIGAYTFGEDCNGNEEIGPANNINMVANTVLHHLDPTFRTSRRRGTTMYQPARVLEAPAPLYPPATAPLITTNARRDRSPSIVTFETAVNHTRFSRVNWDFEGNGSSAEYIQESQQPRYSLRIDKHPYSAPCSGTESRGPEY